LDLIIDLSRVLELLTRWVPELFLCKDQIHASRLLDFVLFVFRSIFRMQMDQLFIEFCDKLQSRSRTLAQVMAPFIGILTNLYLAVNVLTGATDEASKIRQGALAASDSLSPEVNRLNSILQLQAAEHRSQEEVKGNKRDRGVEVESFAQIQ